MWPEPADRAVSRRMRIAVAHVRATLNLRPASDSHEVWGWHGRTLSQPVISDIGPAWLRVASVPAGLIQQIFWDGAIEAERHMPASVPRPRLRSWYDWSDQHWQYRAELYDHVPALPVATTRILNSAPCLPSSWWAAVRSALGDIASVRTGRVTVDQAYLDNAMPRFLGTPVSTTAPGRWTTAHGDFHFANVSEPVLHIFDFEGWGLAPAGYDIATLHSCSVLQPALAARIRWEFSDILSTPSGRFAELVTITELLQAAKRGEHPRIAGPLRNRAALLLGRPIPSAD